MQPVPDIYLGERKLSFSLGFPYVNFLFEVRQEAEDAGVDPSSEAFDDRVAEIYQRRLATEMVEATGFHTKPAPISGVATAGPALINIDYLALPELLLAATGVVSIINDWTDTADKVAKAIDWLKSKAAGQPPVVSDGVALILGSKGLVDATGRKDLVASFVPELGQFPPRREDEPPEIGFDCLVGARTKRWMYLCRVSDRGETSYLGRVHFPASEVTE